MTITIGSKWVRRGLVAFVGLLGLYLGLNLYVRTVARGVSSIGTIRDTPDDVPNGYLEPVDPGHWVYSQGDRVGQVIASMPGIRSPSAESAGMYLLAKLDEGALRTQDGDLIGILEFPTEESPYSIRLAPTQESAGMQRVGHLAIVGSDHVYELFASPARGV